MGIYFLHYWPAPHVLFITHLQVTATSFVISTHADDRIAIKIHAKHPFKESLSTIPNFLNTAASIPIVC